MTSRPSRSVLSRLMSSALVVLPLLLLTALPAAAQQGGYPGTTSTTSSTSTTTTAPGSTTSTTTPSGGVGAGGETRPDAAAGDRLPRTGSAYIGWVTVALALIALGALVVVIERRRLARR